MKEKVNSLAKIKTPTIDQAMDALDDGIQTFIVPYFLIENRKKFVTAVIKLLRRELETPHLSRIFLLFQEGVSKRKAFSIWNELQNRADRALKAAGETPDGNRVSIYSFGNVSTGRIMAFMDTAAEGTIGLEFFDEKEGKQ